LTHTVGQFDYGFYRAACIACIAIYSHEKAVCPSVRLPVCHSNEWIVTKQKKVLFRFLYHMKDHLS